MACHKQRGQDEERPEDTFHHQCVHSVCPYAFREGVATCASHFGRWVVAGAFTQTQSGAHRVREWLGASHQPATEFECFLSNPSPSREDTRRCAMAFLGKSNNPTRSHLRGLSSRKFNHEGPRYHAQVALNPNEHHSPWLSRRGQSTSSVHTRGPPSGILKRTQNPPRDTPERNFPTSATLATRTP